MKVSTESGFSDSLPRWDGSVEEWDEAGFWVRIHFALALIVFLVLWERYYAGLALALAVAGGAVFLLSGRRFTTFAVVVTVLCVVAICNQLYPLGVSSWVNTVNDDNGKGYAPFVTVSALSRLLPGMEIVPSEVQAALPYTNYSLVGGVYAFGTVGLAVYGALLASLVSALFSLGRDGSTFALFGAARGYSGSSGVVLQARMRIVSP